MENITKASSLDQKEEKTMNRCGFGVRTYFTLEEAGINIDVLLDRQPDLRVALHMRHDADWVIYEDEAEEPSDAKKQRWLDLFRYTYETTRDRYELLLGFYRDTREQLLSRLVSKSYVRTNDTPQNGGLFEDDRHTSNYTESGSETDSATPMQRLDEISRLYRDVIDEWVGEFDGLFGRMD